MRIIGLLVTSFVLVLLQGCSAIKLGYNNAPDLIHWWVDGYADLNGEQSLRLREDLERLQGWHRRTQLPRIAELLHQAAELALNDTTPEQACTFMTAARGQSYALLAQAEPAAVRLVISLAPAQIDHIEAKLTKKDAEWRDDWMSNSRAKIRSRRLSKAVERAEQFYGGLEDNQIVVLRDFIARSGFDPQRSYAERQRRQQDLLKTLRQLSTSNGGSSLASGQAEAAVHGFLDRALHSPDAGFRGYLEQEIKDNCKAFADLHNSTSTAQRERAVKRLRAYERDARELAAR